MTCTHFERWIALDLEGDLDQSQGSQVQAHLEECGRCRRFHEELIESQQALRSAHASFSQVFRGGDVRAEVLRRIKAEGLKPARWPVWFFPVFGRWRYACAAGAMAILAAGYAWWGSHPREQQRVVEVVAGDQSADAGAVQQRAPRREGREPAPILSFELAEGIAREPDPAPLNADEKPSTRRNHTAAPDVAPVGKQSPKRSKDPGEPRFEVVSYPSPGAEQQDTLIRVASQDSDIEIYWLIGENGA